MVASNDWPMIAAWKSKQGASFVFHMMAGFWFLYVAATGMGGERREDRNGVTPDSESLPLKLT